MNLLRLLPPLLLAPCLALAAAGDFDSISGAGGKRSLARYDSLAPASVVTASSANPVFAGQPSDFSAQVSGLSPTGTVTFRRAGADIPGCMDVALVSGAASCPGIVLPGGVHAITAAYSGDASNGAAESPPFLQYVLSAATDVDNDGIPDLVEIAEGTDPIVKDNDVFPDTARGWRLFTMQVYRDFLTREGDAGGIDFYSGLLANGFVTREQVIDTFLAAPEFEGSIAPVIRLYFATFNRIPEYAGLQFHAAALRGGASLFGIAWNFTLSAEFDATYGTLTDTQFVEFLYQNVLRRTPTQPEIDFHVARLAAGTTRGEVLTGFSESDEFRQSFASEVLATMMYVGILHRSPEGEGLAYYRDLLGSGVDRLGVIRGFLRSPEYRARFLP